MFTASNPAEVRLQIGHFLKCDLKDLLILAGALVLGGVILIFNWKLALLIVGLGVGVILFSIYQARQHFASGDICAALVIDAPRNLIAVAADLSKGGKSHRVLKVLTQPLGRVGGGPFQRGDRVAFVAMYNGFDHEPRWRNFGGYLVNCGTTNEKTIRRVVESIQDKEWRWLDDAVGEMDQPYRPGLYDM